MKTELYTRKTFEMSAEARLLIDHLRAVKMGEKRSYEQLSTVAGCEITSSSGCLNTAKNRLRTDEQIVFGSIRSFGIERLDDEAIVSSVESDFSRIGKSAKRACKKLQCVEPDKLSLEQQKSLYAKRAGFAAIAHLTTPAKIKQIEMFVNGATPSLGVTLEAFKRDPEL